MLWAPPHRRQHWSRKRIIMGIVSTTTTVRVGWRLGTSGTLTTRRGRTRIKTIRSTIEKKQHLWQVMWKAPAMKIWGSTCGADQADPAYFQIWSIWPILPNYNIYKLKFKFTMTLPSSQSPTFQALILALLISLSACYSSPSSCSSSQFYNYFSYACESCPNSNTARSALDVSYCNCSASSYPNPLSIGFKHLTSCLPLNAVHNISRRL